MPDIPTNEPIELRAGLTWQWEREFADFPAPTWVVTYWFKKTGPTGANFSLVATASGTKHRVTETAANSSTRTAGEYTWAAVAVSGAEAHEVDRGTLKVLPRYDQAANLDDRTHAKKMLESIETALEGFASGSTVKSYTIGSRQMTKADIPELLVLRDRYRNEVQNEEAASALANGQPNPRNIRIRFGSA